MSVLNKVNSFVRTFTGGKGLKVFGMDDVTCRERVAQVKAYNTTYQ